MLKCSACTSLDHDHVTVNYTSKVHSCSKSPVLHCTSSSSSKEVSQCDYADYIHVLSRFPQNRIQFINMMIKSSRLVFSSPGTGWQSVRRPSQCCSCHVESKPLSNENFRWRTCQVPIRDQSSIKSQQILWTSTKHNQTIHVQPPSTNQTNQSWRNRQESMKPSSAVKNSPQFATSTPQCTFRDPENFIAAAQGASSSYDLSGLGRVKRKPMMEAKSRIWPCWNIGNLWKSYLCEFACCLAAKSHEFLIATLASTWVAPHTVFHLFSFTCRVVWMQNTTHCRSFFGFPDQKQCSSRSLKPNFPLYSSNIDFSSST